MRHTIEGRAVRVAVLAASLLALWACSGNEDHYGDPWSDADLDADADSDTDSDADTDTDGDSDADTGADGDVGDADGDYEPLSGPGPLTFIANEAGLISDRLCDLDGDGDMDNTFADLGSPASDLVLMSLNAALHRGYEGDAIRLVHVPWVEDRTTSDGDDIAIISLRGVDIDDPPDATDDRSGVEPFWADWGSLDACGEPTDYIDHARLVSGVIDGSAAVGAIPFLEGLVTTGTRFFGSIAPGGTSAVLLFCSYAAVHDLGSLPGWDDAGDLSLLEVFLAGGDAVGVSSIPGFLPDVDVDHDGLERFDLDDDNHILRCIDGDLTIILGRDCWTDERMADGFSMNVRFQGVPALFDGREPGWETRVHGTCEEPPETSLFDAR